ncbi:MAG: arginase family protein [Candidatus Nanopelagicales bacterium]
MTAALPHDPRWPRASQWLDEGSRRWRDHPSGVPDIGILGVPAHKTSISTTHADRTPAAVRAALARYATWAESVGRDLRELWAVDLGDVPEPDSPQGEARTSAVVDSWPGRLLVALGGDNSLTFAVAQGSRAGGLVTLDAHHDLRDGISNGSPVRRLVEAGMDGSRIVQIGIGDFANSAEYAARAREFGITIIPRDQVEARGMAAVMADAFEIAGGAGSIHVDLDVDVCDRSVAPACPAAVPGGLSAYQLRQAARAAGRDPRVVSVDFAEVDASADSSDQRTVRLVALCVLEVAAGLLIRE